MLGQQEALLDLIYNAGFSVLYIASELHITEKEFYKKLRKNMDFELTEQTQLADLLNITDLDRYFCPEWLIE